MRARHLLCLATLLPMLATPSLAETESPTPPQAKLTPEITGEQFLTRAAFLAGDDMQGRETGTEFGHATEAHVAAEFERFGLEPMGTDGSFFQEVKLPTRTPNAAGSFVTILDAAGDERLGEDDAVLPFGFSPDAEIEAHVAFAGFGLRDDANSYDDYLDVDVTGCAVIVLRHAPMEGQEGSPWGIRGRSPEALAARRMQSFTAKVQVAAAAGAAAVLMVNDYNHEEDSLPVGVRGAAAKIPVLAISRDVADRLLKGTGQTLKELQAAIDLDGAPRSTRIDGVKVRVAAALSSPTGRNVIAVRRGSDPELAKQCVVIGAHIDHVGLGMFGSGGRFAGQIHNGADDNGSGTAALLEVAEFLAAQPPTKRSLVFAGWCAEEKGLVGSRSYAADPTWPLADTIANLNMDMVGYYREGEKGQGIHLGGAATGSGLTELIEGLATDAGARFAHTWNAWEQSDHYAFYAKDIPAVFFTTGLHPDYHKPGDDWWKLNRTGAALVATVVARTATAVANLPTRPEFAKRPPRPVLGVRLGDDPNRDGALLGFVFPGFGAGKAGLKAGDLVTKWNDEVVKSGGALGGLIGASTPGDVVTVTYIRGEEQRTAEVTVTGR